MARINIIPNDQVVDKSDRLLGSSSEEGGTKNYRIQDILSLIEISDVDDLQDTLTQKADLVNGLVASSQLPSFVDEVIEAADYVSLPAIGELGKIYITLNDNKTYRWSGSTYIEVKDDHAVWGSISGILSSQTDLQNALNAKGNLTGGNTWNGTQAFSSNILLQSIGATTQPFEIYFDGHLNFKHNSNTVALLSTTGDFILVNSAGFNARLKVDSVTTQRDFTLPDASGTFALSDVDNNFTASQTISGLSGQGGGIGVKLINTTPTTGKTYEILSYDYGDFAVRDTAAGTGQILRYNETTGWDFTTAGITGNEDALFGGLVTVNGGADITGSLDVSGSTAFNDNVIIDPAGSGTNIAGSLVTVKNTSTSTSTNVPGQFIDVSRNNSTITTTAETTGLVSRVTSTSTVQDFGIYGAQLIGRHSGAGSADFAYGTSNIGESNGTGSVDFVIGTTSESKITGTGTITTDYARGISTNTEVNNPNATVNNAQGIHSTINLGDGTIGNAYVALLDFDYTGTGNISGDFAYLRIQNDTLPSIGGTGYAIRSLSTLPSTFSGKITASNFETTTTNIAYNYFYRNVSAGNNAYTMYVQAQTDSIAKFLYGQSTVGAGTSVLDITDQGIEVGTDTSDVSTILRRQNTGDYIQLYRSGINVGNISASSQGLRLWGLNSVVINPESLNVDFYVYSDVNTAILVDGANGNTTFGNDILVTTAHRLYDNGNYLAVGNAPVQTYDTTGGNSGLRDYININTATNHIFRRFVDVGGTDTLLQEFFGNGKIHFRGTAQSSVPTGTSTSGFLNIGNQTAGTFDYGMSFGVLTSGKGFIQQKRFSGTATEYALQINPLGGFVEFYDNVEFYGSGWNSGDNFYFRTSGAVGSETLSINFNDASVASTKLIEFTEDLVETNVQVRLSNLPTSSTGLSAGDLWNDAGTVKIV